MKRLTFVFIFATLVFTAPAQAETVNCTAITSLPYTITTQGVDRLTGHLSSASASVDAITINTNNVVLDLNGFKLGGLGAGLGTTAIGIYAAQRQNITIRNGTVRGFNTGIKLDDLSPYTTSQGHVIEDIRADQNTYRGMYIAGKGNIIRNNQVVATGGSTLFGPNPPAYGIAAYGPETQVLNNMISEVVAQEVSSSEAIGIRLETAANSVVAGNRIGNVTGVVVTVGIRMISGADFVVSDNRLTGMQAGIIFDGGATGKYFSNVTQGITFPYFGGTAAGTTNY